MCVGPAWERFSPYAVRKATADFVDLQSRPSFSPSSHSTWRTYKCTISTCSQASSSPVCRLKSFGPSSTCPTPVARPARPTVASPPPLPRHPTAVALFPHRLEPHQILLPSRPSPPRVAPALPLVPRPRGAPSHAPSPTTPLPQRPSHYTLSLLCLPPLLPSS